MFKLFLFGCLISHSTCTLDQSAIEPWLAAKELPSEKACDDKFSEVIGKFHPPKAVVPRYVCVAEGDPV